MNDKLIQYNDTPLSEVKSKTKLPPGTFKESAEKIAKVLKSHASSKSHAVKMINFYINRAGDNLSNKKEVMKAKDLIENSKEFSDDYYDKVRRVSQAYRSRPVYNDKQYPTSYTAKKRYKVPEEDQKIIDKIIKDSEQFKGMKFGDVLKHYTN